MALLFLESWCCFPMRWNLLFKLDFCWGFCRNFEANFWKPPFAFAPKHANLFRDICSASFHQFLSAFLPYLTSIWKCEIVFHTITRFASWFTLLLLLEREKWPLTTSYLFPIILKDTEVKILNKYSKDKNMFTKLQVGLHCCCSREREVTTDHLLFVPNNVRTLPLVGNCQCKEITSHYMSLQCNPM